MKIFWELFRESVILQAVLTVGIWGAMIYLVLTSQVIPDIMSQAAYLVLGYYFGSKLSMAKGTTIITSDRRKDEIS